MSLAATLTDIDVCSRALAEIGERPIQSFNEGTARAQACATLYPDHRDHLLSITRWRFALKKAQLARLDAAPINEWRYAFQLPSDQLGGPFAVFATADIGGRPIKDFELFGERLLTDRPQVWIDYLHRAPESIWPGWFVTFVVTAFAARLAPIITDQVSLGERLHVKAWGNPSDNMLGGLYGQARRANGRGVVPQTLTDDGGPLIQARLTGGRRF